MPYAKYTPEEVESRGEAIYQREIRPKVEPRHKGQFLVLDVETGQYEIDEDDVTATKRALAKRPDAVLYGLRIGHPAAYRLGGQGGHPAGTEVNRQGRQPLGFMASGCGSPSGATQRAYRPCGACRVRCDPLQGLTPLAIDCRRVAA